MHHRPIEAELIPAAETEEVVPRPWGDLTPEQQHQTLPHSYHPSWTQAHHPHPGKCCHLHHRDLCLTCDPRLHQLSALGVTHVLMTSHCWRMMAAILAHGKLELRQSLICTICGQLSMGRYRSQTELPPLRTALSGRQRIERHELKSSLL